MKFKNSDPYEEMDRSPCEEHPVDIAARERIPQALTDNIKLATGKLLDALGGDISSWLWLESLINEYRCRRDKVLFNIGHEYGYLAGCTHALARKRRQSSSPACRKLAQQVHKQLTLSGLSPKRCIAILLDTASAILEESAAN